MLIDTNFLSPTPPLMAGSFESAERNLLLPWWERNHPIKANLKRLVAQVWLIYSSHRKVHGVWAESGSLMMLLTDIPPALWNAVGNYFTGAFLCDLCVLCER